MREIRGEGEVKVRVVVRRMTERGTEREKGRKWEDGFVSRNLCESVKMLRRQEREQGTDSQDEMDMTEERRKRRKGRRAYRL